MTAAVDREAACVRQRYAAQPRRLVGLRGNGTIGDAAFQRVREELDWTELGWTQVVRPGESAHGAP
ncbi:hypothetical protein tb265_09460 [Gemmatimonadetes bacterium T265]|nr:hypothetical protein tb265_09460 [Gemmatimonadetes bacterium T265]